MKLSELVQKYVELRDKKALLDAAHKAEMAPYEEKLEKIEAYLLKTFDEIGMDSVKTEHGTAYTTTRTTASVADKDVFMEHIKEHEDWHLMEIRCNKTAVEQYKSANDGALPPGVNWREERKVNIKRA